MASKQLLTRIEKLVFGGQGLSRVDGKVVLTWNALPEELVEIEIIKKKRSFCEGISTRVLEPSTRRITPQEDHYLTCSPWGIMDFEYENEWKTLITHETFRQIGQLDLPSDLDITYDITETSGYRNKIEYSFAGDTNGLLSLAFYQRGKHYKQAIDSCTLASASINETSLRILKWLNHYKFPLRSLKNLIVRSNRQGDTLSALFIKDRVSILQHPMLSANNKGFRVYYSSPKCPAARPDECLFMNGEDYLLEHINGCDLTYGILSFFQINPNLFEHVLTDISAYLDPRTSVVDFYSGVGAISLPLHNKYKECLLVENNEEAVSHAENNIRRNNIANCSCLLVSTEKAVEEISEERIIIFDPPRAGLHPKILKSLLDTKPQRIIYLSCNISTQARDIKELMSAYSLRFVKLYNFFPRTPHIECLCVLDKK